MKYVAFKSNIFHIVYIYNCILITFLAILINNNNNNNAM